MRDDLFLRSQTAVRLYETAAKDLPIFDYHCHLSAMEIYEDKPFDNIGRMWLEGDHYKWRLMRSAGVAEKYITGDADYYDKFCAYARVISGAIGNPLYVWSHMELSKFFGIEEALNEQTCERIWEKANAVIKETRMSPKKLIADSDVRYIGTTDDPVDSLEYHRLLKEDPTFQTAVCPTFRPDKALMLDAAYINKLAGIVGYEISSIDSLKAALCERLDFFVQAGCTIADCGIPLFPKCSGDEQQAEEALCKALAGDTPDSAQREQYLFYMMRFLAGEYRKRGIVMQLHMAVKRNVNRAMFERLGADTGFDIVGDPIAVEDLARLFSAVMDDGGLPKTIVYTLNPSMYYTLAALIGSFQSEVRGKLQLGSAWWFCDHRDGITEQLKVTANTGNLGAFVGMLTDSRSFLSYTRHDYFRRVLCNLVGEWVEGNEIFDDGNLEQIIKDICFYNAENYFIKSKPDY